jgi:hypothetical protein
MAVPPNTMPPISPLPIGSAWFIHSVAGRSYQSTSAGSATSAVSTGRTTSTIGPRPTRPAAPPIPPMPVIPDLPPHAAAETAASASAAPAKTCLSCAIGRKSNKRAQGCQQDLTNARCGRQSDSAPSQSVRTSGPSFATISPRKRFFNWSAI